MTQDSSLISPYARLEQLLGKDAVDRFKNARVAVFGLGAVGSFVVEALARSGIGYLRLVDLTGWMLLISTGRYLLCTPPWGRKKPPWPGPGLWISIPIARWICALLLSMLTVCPGF